MPARYDSLNFLPKKKIPKTFIYTVSIFIVNILIDIRMTQFADFAVICTEFTRHIYDLCFLYMVILLNEMINDEFEIGTFIAFFCLQCLGNFKRFR